MTPEELRELASLIAAELRRDPPVPRLALGVDAAAFALDVSRDHLYRLNEQGVLRATAVGGRLVWPVAMLEAYLVEHPAIASRAS